MGIRGRGAVERSYPRPTRWGLNLAVLYPVGEDFTTLTPPNRGIPRRVPGTGAPLPPLRLTRVVSCRPHPSIADSLAEAPHPSVTDSLAGWSRVSLGGDSADRLLGPHVIGRLLLMPPPIKTRRGEARRARWWRSRARDFRGADSKFVQVLKILGGEETERERERGGKAPRRRRCSPPVVDGVSGPVRRAALA